MYDSRNPTSCTCRSTVALNWCIRPFSVWLGYPVTLWEGTDGETQAEGNGFGIWNRGTPFTMVFVYVSVTKMPSSLDVCHRFTSGFSRVLVSGSPSMKSA